MGEAAVSVLAVRDVTVCGRLLSDERLARLVSRGDVRAFELLYERHGAALHRYCRSILRDDEDTADALQNAMTSALAALLARERDIAVRPWLFRIVHNEAISLLRRRRPTEAVVDERAAGFSSVEHTAEENERLATLMADLHSLGERHRAALVMRELCGNSIGEIAATLSTSPGAAKQALFEARTALHELVEGRAMECEAVRRLVSARDGRILRGRKVRAHLRACAGCEEFRGLIVTRSADLRLLAPPVPAAAAATAWLAGGGAGAGAAGATGGGTALAPLGAKLLAGMAITAAATSATIPLRLLRPASSPAPEPVLHAARASAIGVSRAPESPGLQGRAHGGAAQPRHHDVASAPRTQATGRAAGPGAPADGLPQPWTATAGTAGSTAAVAGSVAAPPQSAPALAPGVATRDDLPPGLAKRDDPPPGLAERDGAASGRGGHDVPPGLAKQDDPPPGLAKQDDSPPGQAEHHELAAPANQDDPPAGRAQSGDAASTATNEGSGSPPVAGQQGGHGTR